MCTLSATCFKFIFDFIVIATENKMHFKSISELSYLIQLPTHTSLANIIVWQQLVQRCLDYFHSIMLCVVTRTLIYTCLRYQSS